MRTRILCFHSKPVLILFLPVAELCIQKATLLLSVLTTLPFPRDQQWLEVLGQREKSSRWEQEQDSPLTGKCAKSHECKSSDLVSLPQMTTSSFCFHICTCNNCLHNGLPIHKRESSSHARFPAAHSEFAEESRRAHEWSSHTLPGQMKSPSTYSQPGWQCSAFWQIGEEKNQRITMFPTYEHQGGYTE